MTDPLTLDRFRDLADAYGGVVARWPVSDRLAAQRFAATAQGRAILAEAIALDERLDHWIVPAFAPALAARVTGHVAVRTTGGRQRWWWSGIGIAATLAGAVAGAAGVAVVAPIDMVTASTSFGDVAGVDG
ncbi:hypothetical protein [Sphingomonas sp. Mn802worker]|uniref:hypothetical protein n=1 Tax=Sphingomonas sp. Mn802worker TaxID=629773 RepID=UPI000369403E|nr:hypothetical protein [Sphingomonas sp. Mn802worker]